MMFTEKELELRFNSHDLGEYGIEMVDAVRDKARVLAVTLAVKCPESREKSIAITKLEEVVFWANAAIARRGKRGRQGI